MTVSINFLKFLLPLFLLAIFSPSPLFAQTSAPNTTSSQGYTLLAPFPGTPASPGLATYLQALFSLILGAAVILAVIMIVVGGIEYMSESVFTHGEGKKRIIGALTGLLLAFLSYIILNAINPELLRVGFNLPGIQLEGARFGADLETQWCTFVVRGGQPTGENLGGCFDTQAECKEKQLGRCNGTPAECEKLLSEREICRLSDSNAVPLPDRPASGQNLPAQQAATDALSLHTFKNTTDCSNKNSTPLQNITDASNGLPGHTGNCGDDGERTVLISPEMLNGLRSLGENGFRLEVNSVAGGDHSDSSRHYDGRAFDAVKINGVGVSLNGNGRDSALALMAACRRYGATEVKGPGDKDHDTHVHCAW